MSKHVLHIVDRVGGGVPVAAATYIRNSSANVNHTVLTPFAGPGPAAVWDNVVAGFQDLREGHLTRIRQVRRVVKELRPDVVHAHSSFAGGYTRLAIRRRKHRIVYSPHCFGFERRDIGRVPRALLRAAESLLGWNTDVLAACSLAEKEQGESIASLRGRSMFVPNLASIPTAQGAKWGAGPIRIGMSGRLSPQKDPDYFLAAVESLQKSVGVDAVWIGDGEPALVQKLEDAGVRVTGWLGPDDLAREMSSLHLYAHSAAWEGFPLAVLDAHAANRPIIVRPIRAFAHVDREATIEVALHALPQHLQSPENFHTWAAQNLHGWSQYLDANTLASQRTALDRVWNVS